MRNSPRITAARLRELLRYDPETGLFWWRPPGRRKRLDVPVGSKERTGFGYVRIGLEGRDYRAHQLAWLYVHGHWPVGVDHINRDPSDNRIANLREATQSKNGANRIAPSNNTSGVKGVSRHSDGRWRAQIAVGRRRIHIGLYASLDDARAAYTAAAEEHFGEFARAG